MANRIAISNQKGGVGKTATAVNLGAALAQIGSSVLLIDLDPQAGLTTSLGYLPDQIDDSLTTYDVLNSSVRPLDAILATKVGNMALIPSSMELATFEASTGPQDDWHMALSNQLKSLEKDYDYVIIDCPPSLGKLTVNALVYAHLVIVPIQTDFLAFIGTEHLIDILDDLKKDANPELDIRFLRTMYVRRTKHAQEVSFEALNAFDAVLEPIIPYTVKFKDASVAGLPITHVDPTHLASKMFVKLANEITSYFNHG